MDETDIPHIRVDISHSPLVSSYPRTSGCSEIHLFASSATDSTTPSSHFYSQRHAANSSSSSLLSNCPTSSSSSSTTSTLSGHDTRGLSKSRIPATAILSLLNLLDEFDADVETQVVNIKESIRETRSLVKLCRVERVEKLTRARQRKEANDRGTLGADSEFWCSI